MFNRSTEKELEPACNHYTSIVKTNHTHLPIRLNRGRVTRIRTASCEVILSDIGGGIPKNVSNPPIVTTAHGIRKKTSPLFQ